MTGTPDGSSARPPSSVRRATSDLDTVDRRRNDEPSQLELLIRTGATRSGPSGALVDTPAGRIHVLEVTDAALDQLPDDPTGRAPLACPQLGRLHGLPGDPFKHRGFHR